MAVSLLIQHRYYYYAIAPLLIYLTYKLYVRATLRLPPGPRSWPIVGNLYDLKPVRFQCFSEWAERYGPIISFRLGADLNVVVSSAELAREVLKEKDEQLADRCGSRREGTGLTWADYGPHFVKVRKMCSLELLSSKRLEALRSIREEEVNAMIESIYNNSINLESRGEGSLVVRKYLGAVALNTMTRLAFGKRFESSELIEAVVENGPELEEESLALVEHIPLLRWMLRSNKKDDAHGARRDTSIRAIMEERVGKPNQQHFVDALCALDKDEHQLTHDTIVALLRDMMTGGMDTIAVSVEWAMAELMRNPRIQKKAQAELDRGIGADRVMTEWDFSNLPYLRCIVKEALRLHPPTPLMLPHRARSRVRLGGYDIPKGSTVHVNVWAIARDLAHWRNPLEFRPERFMEEDVDLKGHDFRLLPFGAGRRACPGAQLAMNLVTSILGHLLHHFNWTAPDGLMPGDIDVSEAPGIVASMSTPLQAIPVPRLSPHLYKRSQTLDDMDFHI